MEKVAVIYYCVTLKTLLLQSAYIGSKEEAVATAESDVKNELVSGHHQFECKGLGYSPGPKSPSNKSAKLYRKFISCHYKNIDDTYFVSKAVQLQVPSIWT